MFLFKNTYRAYQALILGNNGLNDKAVIIDFLELHFFKNFGLYILFILILASTAFPQIVTTSPQYPTGNDSIIVYFDATQPGATALLNYTGDIYAHTGVITNLSSNDSDWKYVMAPWAVNYPDIKMVRDSVNHYHLVIGYPIKYYSANHQNLGSIPSSEKILKLAFVFRNSDGSKQTRPDIFYKLYESNSYSINLISPQISNPFSEPLNSPVFLNAADTLNIKAKAAALNTISSSLNLYVNGIQKKQTSADSIEFSFIASQYQSHINSINIVGTDTSGKTDTVNFSVVVNPKVNLASMPAGVQPGINYNSSTSVTLALFAPHKSFVYVLGDFNNWDVNTSYFMYKDSSGADSVIWWLTINNLSPGKEYAFQYLVDGNLRIADPYTHKVLDPNNDGYIPSSVYPNLKPYPSGKTAHIVSVLQTAQESYNWQVSNFKKPDKYNLTIYELLIRDFVSMHDYTTLADTLDYLKTLGVNAIELMPVMEFEGNDSWGYNPDFHLALDKYYGTPEAFKKFIDKAHSMGIAVILDIVLNHAYDSNPLVRLYWDSKNNRPAPDNPWFNITSPNPVFSYGYDFNHQSKYTQYYVDRVTSYWIKEYHIDGYRFDFAKGFTNTPGDGSGYDQSRINIWKRIGDQIWKVDSTSILILENFVNNDEEKVESSLGFLSWGNMNYNYSQASMGYQYGPSGDNYSWDLTGGYYVSRGWPEPSLVTYMESHDEERLMYKNLQYGNSDSAFYNIKNLNTALNRIKLCEAFFYTIPGPKMLWQFGELGYDYSIDYNSRIGDKPIKWDYYNDPARLSLYKTTAALINLKEDYTAFKSTNVTIDLKNAVKRIYIVDSTMNVAVIGNFDVQPHSIDPSFPTGGTWYDYLTGDSLVTPNGHGGITLNAGDFHIYTSVKLPLPDLQVPTGINEGSSSVIKSYNLEQNYPNPFNPSTTIKYQIPQSGLVTLKIYDVLGREVKTLINGYKQSGTYQITFNGNGLASGIYFYRLDANNFISVKKMILMK